MIVFSWVVIWQLKTVRSVSKANSWGLQFAMLLSVNALWISGLGLLRRRRNYYFFGLWSRGCFGLDSSPSVLRRAGASLGYWIAGPHALGGGSWDGAGKSSLAKQAPRRLRGSVARNPGWDLVMGATCERGPEVGVGVLLDTSGFPGALPGPRSAVGYSFRSVACWLKLPNAGLVVHFRRDWPGPPCTWSPGGGRAAASDPKLLLLTALLVLAWNLSSRCRSHIVFNMLVKLEISFEKYSGVFTISELFNVLLSFLRYSDRFKDILCISGPG